MDVNFTSDLDLKYLRNALSSNSLGSDSAPLTIAERQYLQILLQPMKLFKKILHASKALKEFSDKLTDAAFKKMETIEEARGMRITRGLLNQPPQTDFGQNGRQTRPRNW